MDLAILIVSPGPAFLEVELLAAPWLCVQRSPIPHASWHGPLGSAARVIDYVRDCSSLHGAGQLAKML